MKNVLVLLLLSFGLAACGDSSAPLKSAGTILKAGDDSAAFSAYVDSLCDEISGGDTAVQFEADPTCVDCAADDQPKAIDGTDATFATLNFAPLTQGPLTFRATAPSGVVYPGGTIAGVTFSAPQNTNFITVVSRTFLRGVEQESECDSSAFFDADSRSLIGVSTTLPFDALEVELQRGELNVVETDCGLQVLSVSNPNQAIEPRAIRVHEFCHTFRIPQ